MNVVRINVVTIFPETMDVMLATGILGQAAKKALVEFRTRNPRDFQKTGVKTFNPFH